MQWENLTATEFATAVRDTGVCVLAPTREFFSR